MKIVVARILEFKEIGILRYFCSTAAPEQKALCWIHTGVARSVDTELNINI